MRLLAGQWMIYKAVDYHLPCAIAGSDPTVGVRPTVAGRLACSHIQRVHTSNQHTSVASSEGSPQPQRPERTHWTFNCSDAVHVRSSVLFPRPAYSVCHIVSGRIFLSRWQTCVPILLSWYRSDDGFWPFALLASAAREVLCLSARTPFGYLHGGRRVKKASARRPGRPWTHQRLQFEKLFRTFKRSFNLELLN